jgi:transposase-like protein
METATTEETPTITGEEFRQKISQQKIGRKTRRRHNYSVAEKRALIEKWRKSGLGTHLGARKLGVHNSMLRRWLADKNVTGKAPAVAKPKPKKTLKRPYYAPSNLSDNVKRKAVEEFQSGKTPIAMLAKKLKVNESSIRNWHKKFGSHKAPSGWEVRRQYAEGKRGKTGKGERQTYTAEYKQKAIARVKAGETTMGVAEQLGISTGMLSNWVAGRGLGQTGHNRPAASAPAIVDDVQLTKNGKHDAIVFLRMARDEGNLRVQSGKMRIDDKLILYPMLALQSLGEK